MIRVALALLLLAASANAQSLVFAGRPASRDPFKVGVDLAWYHCGVPPDEAHPIRVALQEGTFALGGGDVLYPGTTIDLRGAGVWIDVPAVGTIPFLWCEQRYSQSFVHVDPLGQFRSIVAWKIKLFTLEPGKWQNVSGNIVGMLAWEVRAEGGTVWIGSHLDTSKTPFEENDTSGVSWPLDAGQSQSGPGNPYLWAWTNVPGAKLRFKKLERGFTW